MEARQAVLAAINAKTLLIPREIIGRSNWSKLLGERELRPQDLIVPEPFLQAMEFICLLPSVPIVLPA
jgi:hypothetical protein